MHQHRKSKLGIEQRGVRLLALGGRMLRAVTHYQVTEDGVATSLAAAREVLGPGARS